MKSVLLQSLRPALAVLLLAGGWQLAYRGPAVPDIPQRLLAGALTMFTLAALFAVLFRRMRSEDRIARLEADLCRAQNARSQADQALAEAELLLARLAARAPGHAGKQEVMGREVQLIAQLPHIQTELALIQQYTALDPSCATRIERARDRLEQVARVVRTAARATEPG